MKSSRKSQVLLMTPGPSKSEIWAETSLAGPVTMT